MPLTCIYVSTTGEVESSGRKIGDTPDPGREASPPAPPYVHAYGSAPKPRQGLLRCTPILEKP